MENQDKNPAPAMNLMPGQCCHHIILSGAAPYGTPQSKNAAQADEPHECLLLFFITYCKIRSEIANKGRA